MITKAVIENLYKQYKRKPASPDMLDLSLLFEHAIENHALYVDDGNLVIESIDADSPFHELPLDRIHAIHEFDRVVAIVLPAAIVFLNKRDSGVNVHIKAPKLSFLDRMRDRIHPEAHPDF